MPDDDREAKLEWLREPPAAGEVRVTVECGDGVELSEEAKQALEVLMTELTQAELQGYAFGSFDAGGLPTGGIETGGLGSMGLSRNLNIFTVNIASGQCGKACKKT